MSNMLHYLATNPIAEAPAMLFRQLFDPVTSTYTYLVADLQTHAAILIDPVLEQHERDLQLLKELGLSLRYCLETHIHADHITGAGKLRAVTGCKNIVPNLSEVDCADQLLRDGATLVIDGITVLALATPGHTDSHMAYLINGTHLLTGDSLLIRGCGRTDFQSGDPGVLFDSITEKIWTLPDTTLIYPGHDYRGHTVSSVGEEKRYNPRLVGKSRQDFIALMNGLNLPNPQKIMEAVPANQKCGDLAATSA